MQEGFTGTSPFYMQLFHSIGGTYRTIHTGSQIHTHTYVLARHKLHISRGLRNLMSIKMCLCMHQLNASSNLCEVNMHVNVHFLSFCLRSFFGKFKTHPNLLCSVGMRWVTDRNKSHFCKMWRTSRRKFRRKKNLCTEVMETQHENRM